MGNTGKGVSLPGPSDISESLLISPSIQSHKKTQKTASHLSKEDSTQKIATYATIIHTNHMGLPYTSHTTCSEHTSTPLLRSQFMCSIEGYRQAPEVLMFTWNNNGTDVIYSTSQTPYKLYAVESLAYKKVANRVIPVATTLPEHFRIEQ